MGRAAGFLMRLLLSYGVGCAMSQLFISVSAAASLLILVHEPLAASLFKSDGYVQPKWGSL